MASPTKMITTQARMTANERATRSRRLNVIACSSREKAVIAIPAVNSWLIVFKPVNKTCTIVPTDYLLPHHLPGRLLIAHYTFLTYLTAP